MDGTILSKEDVMLYLIIIVPWLLTVATLLFIMVYKRNDDEDDGFFDGDAEVVKVAVYEDRAYWVHENVFYESEVTREPDFSTAKPIDTALMPQKELEKLMGILDELQNYTERD